MCYMLVECRKDMVDRLEGIRLSNDDDDNESDDDASDPHKGWAAEFMAEWLINFRQVPPGGATRKHKDLLAT